MLTGREVALARLQRESLRRISTDWVEVASSLDAEDSAGRFRDLNHPPSIKKTMRRAGVALAVAPEPFTTMAGVALFAGSFAMKGEPATLRSIAEELCLQTSELSNFDLVDLTISL